MKTNYLPLIEKTMQDLIKACSDTVASCHAELLKLGGWICEALNDNGKLLIFGNGGSAADSQHIAAEFINRFRLERRPLPAIALTTDTSILTAISNDYDFDLIFSKQIEALAASRDIVLGISTSGDSRNVLTALDAARDKGAKTAVFTGKTGGEAAKHADLVLSAASTDTPRIQEIHIFLAHILCDIVEQDIFGAR